MKKYKFHVHGMHCNSCVILTENKIGEMPNVSNVEASLKNNTVEFDADFGDKTDAEIAEELTLPLKDYGYKVSVEKEIVKGNFSEFKIAIPIALGFVFLYVLLQKLGIVNLVGGGNVTYGTIFLVGIIASFSTCMAVVGGLVLSMSATFAKEGDKIRPQLMFHISRVVSFFILGGILGAIGSVFTLGTIGTFILSLIIAVVMIILGINLLDVFPWAKQFQLSIPKFIGKRAEAVSNINHTFTPFLVGIATFFLPCGFTQSMQLYALATGTFLSGGLTMFFFALGTLPVLALISFSSFSIKDSKKSGIFFKSAGLIVIMFALFNLINSLVVIGAISPVFNF